MRKPAAGLLFYVMMQKFFMQKAKLEETATFIREHRSKEESFEKLMARLEETESDGTNGTFKSAVESIRIKAEAYLKARETGGTAWPEFEKFVSEFEKTVMEAMKEAA